MPPAQQISTQLTQSQSSPHQFDNFLFVFDLEDDVGLTASSFAESAGNVGAPSPES